MEVQYLDGEEETSNYVSRGGKVRVTYANGDVFEGEFDYRKLKQGKGKYTFMPNPEAEENPCEYVGQYTDGERTGVGKMTYADGTIYRGQWLQGFRHGIGSFTYENGDIYSGEWKNNLRHGKGTYLHEVSKCRLDATWENGQPTNGEFCHPDGTSYTGNFADGNFTGEYALKFPTGIQVRGEFYKCGHGSTKQDRWKPIEC